MAVYRRVQAVIIDLKLNLPR